MNIEHQNKSWKVIFLGVVINIFLSIIKLTFGWMGNSRALFADGLHSVFDLLTDLIAGIGVYFKGLPADEDHQFGHQKIETLSEIILGIVLISVAVAMATQFGKDVYYHREADVAPYTIIVAFISLVMNEWLYYVTAKVGKEVKSKVIHANAWHHRSDSLSSLVVLIGLIVSTIFPSLKILDAYLGLFVSFIILKIGVDTTWDAIKRIVDTVPSDTRSRVCEVIKTFESVRGYHHIKSRYIGAELHIELHIEVDPQMSVYNAHEVSHLLKDAIMDKFEDIYDVLIHVEPLGDDRFGD